MSFLFLIDAHNAEVRINVSRMDSYSSVGGYTVIMCGETQYNVINTVSDIDNALSELYITVKKVGLSNVT